MLKYATLCGIMKKQIARREGAVINISHMKYAVEVAKVGSLKKAAETLFIAVPNISRSIKELESDLGIAIFDRTTKGMLLTPEGEEFINFAKGILNQIESVEKYYRAGVPDIQKFSISVPRACYISDAFAEFSKTLTKDSAQVFYKETNAQQTIDNMLNHDYKLGIIRYAENYEKYFKEMLDEKGFEYEVVTEFSYSLIMSANNPLARKDEITFDDLKGYIEIAHADPFVPAMPLSKVVKEELQDNINRRIYIFERASQFDLLDKNAETFMWVSPAPDSLLERYNLVQRKCIENKKLYKDILIYKKGYKLTELDCRFIAQLRDSKTKIFNL